MKNSNSVLRIPLLIFIFLIGQPGMTQIQSTDTYEDFLRFFKEWRAFEAPPLREGAPDYTMTTFENRWPTFKKLQSKLLAMDITGWTVAEQVDWNLVKAEMNGYDFNHRILRPWTGILPFTNHSGWLVAMCLHMKAPRTMPQPKYGPMTSH